MQLLDGQQGSEVAEYVSHWIGRKPVEDNSSGTKPSLPRGNRRKSRPCHAESLRVSYFVREGLWQGYASGVVRQPVECAGRGMKPSPTVPQAQENDLAQTGTFLTSRAIRLISRHRTLEGAQLWDEKAP